MQRLAVRRARLYLQNGRTADFDKLSVLAQYRAVGGLGRHQLFEKAPCRRLGGKRCKAGKCLAHFRLPSVSFFAFLSFFEKEILFSVWLRSRSILPRCMKTISAATIKLNSTGKPMEPCVASL